MYGNSKKYNIFLFCRLHFFVYTISMSLLEEDNLTVEEAEQMTGHTVKHENEKHRSSFLAVLLAVFAVLFVTSVFITQIYLTPMVVIGKSMQPTINAKYQEIVVNGQTQHKYTDTIYLRAKSTYNRGEIVVANVQSYKQEENADYYIKRVIALPGETVQLIPQTTGSNMYVVQITDTNGNTYLLNETYLSEPMQIVIDISAYPWYTKVIEEGITLEKDQYYLLGDNRKVSEDSRFLGPISVTHITGHVVLHVPYGRTLFYAILQKIFG